MLSLQLVLDQSKFQAFKFSDRVLNSTGALNLDEIPKKLVVIGGGYIGTELRYCLC